MCQRHSGNGPKPAHHFVATGIFIVGFFLIGIFLIVHGGKELKRIGDIENNEFETTCSHTSAVAIQRDGQPELCCVDRPTSEGCIITGGYYDEKVIAERPCGDKVLSLNTDAEDRVCRSATPTINAEFKCWANCDDVTYGYNDTAPEDAEAGVLLILGVVLMVASCTAAYYSWYSDYVLLLFEDETEPQKQPLAMDRRNDPEQGMRQERGVKMKRKRRADKK